MWHQALPNLVPYTFTPHISSNVLALLKTKPVVPPAHSNGQTLYANMSVDWKTHIYIYYSRGWDCLILNVVYRMQYTHTHTHTYNVYIQIHIFKHHRHFIIYSLKTPSNLDQLHALLNMMLRRHRHPHPPSTPNPILWIHHKHYSSIPPLRTRISFVGQPAVDHDANRD